MEKKIFISVALLTIATLAMAQKQSVGVQLGFTEPILRENTLTSEKKLSNKTINNGFKVGVVYDATLVKGFGMSVALNYAFAADAGKWQNENPTFIAKKIRTQRTLHTLELPIEWQYKFRIATDTWLIAYTGPVLQYNIAMKETVSRRNTITKEASTTTLNHYAVDADNDSRTDYTKFNIQWGIGAGFQYKNYYLRGGYNFGIYSPFRDTYNDLLSYTNRGRADEWNLRLGIYFLNF